jgi:hypothetical protein
MDRAGQVVHGGVLIEMRVHDDLQRLELFEDSIHRRWTDVRLAFLYFMGDLVGCEVPLGGDEHFGDGSLRDRRAPVSPSNRRDDLVHVVLLISHEKTLWPWPHVASDFRRGQAFKPAITCSACSTIERTMSPAGRIEVMAPTACPAGYPSRFGSTPSVVSSPPR